MTDDQLDKGTSMVNELFFRLHQENHLTPKQIAHALGQDDRSGYRWIGKYIPDVEQYRTVFLACREKPAVQRQMMGYFLDGTPWIIEPVALEADINGDHDVDTDDVLDGTILALDRLTRVLQETREQQQTGLRRIPPARAQAITLQINEAVRNLLSARKVVTLITAPQPSRVASRL